MDIEGSVSRLLNPVEKNSTLIGAGIAALGRLPIFEDGIRQLMAGHVHAPDFDVLISAMTQRPDMLSAYALAIGGYLLKDAVSNSTLKKLAVIAEKAAIGYIAVNAASFILDVSTHSGSCAGNLEGGAGISDLSGSRGYS